MLYKPKYCSNCGDKIERIEWFAWTSRNFCQVCETEHKVFDRLPVIFVAIIGLLGVFNLGSYLWSDNSATAVSENQQQIKTLKQKNPTKNEQAASNKNGTLPNAGNESNQNVEQSDVPTTTNLLKPEVPQVQQPTVRQTEDVPIVAAKEPVYFCGAQTKKGTPCSRKVKGGGRCWQHEGRAAMLPPEKLLISQ